MVRVKRQEHSEAPGLVDDSAFEQLHELIAKFGSESGKQSAVSASIQSKLINRRQRQNEH